MTLDEAIQHCRDKENCSQCGQEHKRLREWLEELKDLRSKYNLPTPHGRLIDADRLEDRIKNMVGKYGTAIPLNVVYRLIADAHPIIEAEGFKYDKHHKRVCSRSIL